MDNGSRFISCDWGTSSFRLRLVELNSEPGSTSAIGQGPETEGPGGWRILAEFSSEEGIAFTFERWKKTEGAGTERLSFYRSILETGIDRLQQSYSDGISTRDFSLQHIPVIISGMASSSIGMKELPYKELPFRTDGKDLFWEQLEITPAFGRKTLLVSGARSSDDVMRGEEIQLIGCIPYEGRGGTGESVFGGGVTAGHDRIYIFPGTHSKHIRVKDGQAVGFSTYMTGEYFALLSKHSILSVSVSMPQGLLQGDLLHRFEQGVRDSVKANILHQSFLVRTNQLFGKMSKEENYFYLSGLLIGTECKDLIGSDTLLTLVSGGALQLHYQKALQQLGFSDLTILDLDRAVIQGQARLFSNAL